MFAELNKLLAHSARYAAGSAFAMIAGMVSFAILTRNLPVEDYGRLSLITITITLVVTFAKMGISHATVRFYSEASGNNSSITTRQYYGTVLLSALGSGLLFALCTAAVSHILAANGFIDDRISTLMKIAASMVFLRVIFSALQNISRAEEKSGLFAVYQSLSKLSWLVTISGIAIFVGLTLELTVVAMLISDTLIVAIAVFFVLRRRLASVTDFSPPLLGSMLAFGLPLLGMEAADTILQTADRYVINGILGPQSVGIYAAACTLSEYANSLIVLPAALAILPMFLRIHEEEGRQATSDFLQKCVSIAAIIFPAVVAGAAAVAADILLVLSGEHYARGAALVPIIVASLFIGTCTPIFAASLNIGKMTTVIFKIASLGAIINLAMNFVLIPRFGTTGAALSSLFSYSLMLAITIRVSRPIRVAIPWLRLLKYSLVAGAMYLILQRIGFSASIFSIVAKIVLGSLFYFGVVFLLEKDIRNLVRNRSLLDGGVA